MKNFLICFCFLTIQAVFSQQETVKDTIKTTELNEVVMQYKKKRIDQ